MTISIGANDIGLIGVIYDCSAPVAGCGAEIERERKLIRKLL